MKIIQVLIVYTLAIVATRVADGAELAGFIFANATGLEQKSILKVDGLDVSMGGFSSGVATSGLGFPVGVRNINLLVDGLRPVNYQLEIQIGKCPILVSYIIPRVTVDGNLSRYISLFVPTPIEEQDKEFVSRIFYIPSNQIDQKSPIKLKINKQEFIIEPLQPITVKGKNISIEIESATLPDPDLELPGNYAIFVFKDILNKYSSLVVPEIIYTW